MTAYVPNGSFVDVANYTTANQVLSGATRLANGTMVVVWHTLDEAQDGSTTAVKMRLFSPAGLPLGDERLVNTFTSADQFVPEVTALPGGGFVVAWYSSGSVDRVDNLSSIEAQVFDASGAKVGREFRVNAETAGWQDHPATAGLGNGGFVVVWETRDTSQDGSGYAIKAQVYSAVGTALGGEFLVNTTAAGDQTGVEVAALSDGGFVVTWQIGNDANSEIYAQCYAGDGTARGGEILVSQDLGKQTDASVAALPDGGFVVTWVSTNLAVPPDSEIRAQIFDGSGNKSGAEFTVNANPTGGQILPDVVVMDDGDIAFSWGESAGYKVRVFDGVGQALGPEATIATAYDALTGELLATVDGGLAFAWTARAPTTTYDLNPQLQMLKLNGAPDLGDATRIVSAQEGGTAIITLMATDDGGPLPSSYSIVGGADAALFTLSNTGLLQFVSPHTSDAPNDADLDNGYEVIVQVSDGDLIDTQAITVNVTAVKEPPVIISNGGGVTAALSVDENTSAVTTISAQGGSAIVYAIAGGDDAALFAIDAETGALSFDAAPDFEAPADADGDNVYEVIVSASDGALSDTQGLFVSVGDITEPAIYSRAGTEFTLNTRTVGNQSTPSVAGFAGGGFVAVWTTADTTQDGSSSAIKFQLYNAAGVAVGSETRVNTAGSLIQRFPSVTTLGSGNFLVTWETTDATQDGAGTAIKAQLFSGGGAAIGGEFRVNTQGVADQTNPVVTGLADGGFLVAWRTADAAQDGTSSAIKAQRYDAAGAAVGAEFLVNPTGMGGENAPHLTALAGGGFLASWTLGSGTNADIYAQLFDAAGAKIGAAFRVNSVTALHQDLVSATQLADGSIVMTWASAASLTTHDGDIKAQVFSASGVRIDGEFTVNTTRIDPDSGFLVGPTRPQVDDLPSGGFVITWTQGNIDDGIRGQFYDADAQRVGGEVLVNTATDRIEREGDIAVDGLGRILAVWNSGAKTSPFDYNIHGQVFTSAPGVAIASNGGGDTAAVSVAENTSAVTTVSASGAPGIAYALVSGFDAARFTIDATSGALAFVSPPNFEAPGDSNGNTLYRVVIRATNGTHVDVQELRVTVTNVNEAPSFTGSGGSIISYHENWTDPVVATVAAVDPDGDTLVYSLTGTDADYFTISATGVLAFAAPADYEAVVNAGGDHYLGVTVVASDGTFTVNRALTIDLFDQNEGPIITVYGGGDSASLTVAENIEAVGYVGVIDPDWLDDVDIGTIPPDVIFDWIVRADYEFTVSGPDAALFAIQNPTGYLYFLGGRDFEAPSDADGDGVYEVTVTVSDGFAPTDSQALSITITGANDRPVITSNGGDIPAAILLDENLVAVTTVTAADPEGGVSYSLTGGVDAALFAIDAVTGALTFVAAPDFEAPADADGDNVYHVIVSASDGSLSDAQALSVSVIDVAEYPPFALAVTAFEVDENTSAPAWLAVTGGAGVGAVQYSITGGADAELFWVDGLTGELQLEPWDFEAPALDQDGDNVYEVEITAERGADSVSGLVTVELRDVDEAPVFLPPHGFLSVTLAENLLAAARLSAFDPEGQAVSFALLDVLDYELFTIDPQSGALSFLAAPDFEAPTDGAGNNIYELGVAVSDGEQVSYGTIEIHLTDVAETLTFAETAFAVWENALPVATLSASGNPATTAYAITGGADAALFAIDVATGALGFLAAPDFEAPADADGDNVYEVTVGAIDGTTNGTQALSITVGNVDEAPLITSAAAVSASEGATAVTVVAATDPEGGVNYAITGGADAALLTIDAATGELGFVAAPDFEAPADSNGDNVYELVVSASDGSLSDTQALAITVTSTNEAPAIVSDGGGTSAALELDEGALGVTTVVGADVDGGTVLTYVITGGPDAALFAIDAASGALSFVAAPDFEAPADMAGDNFYTVVVTVSDGALTASQAISVLVRNVNEGLAITSPAATSAFENATAVMTVAASDIDGDAVGYAITGGTDAARFAIDAATGALSFVAAPDFEAPGDADGDNVYEVTVSASDGQFVAAQALAVTLGNANEAPAITSGGGGAVAAYAIDENATAVATIAASDPEGAVTYALVGGADAALFMIDATTGVLRFIAAPDYDAPADADADNVYAVIVSAGDGSLDDTQALAVTVGNLPDGLAIAGSADADQLTGSYEGDRLSGLAGDDTLAGEAGDDVSPVARAAIPPAMPPLVRRPRSICREAMPRTPDRRASTRSRRSRT